MLTHSRNFFAFVDCFTFKVWYRGYHMHPIPLVSTLMVKMIMIRLKECLWWLWILLSLLSTKPFLLFQQLSFSSTQNLEFRCNEKVGNLDRFCSYYKCTFTLKLVPDRKLTLPCNFVFEFLVLDFVKCENAFTNYLFLGWRFFQLR